MSKFVHVLVRVGDKVIHVRSLPSSELLEFIDKQFKLGFTVEVQP